MREEGSRLGPIKVIIEAPEHLPALPSAVEVAAYRIAGEALTNVVRHSDAQRASVRLSTVDGTLEMIITDNGSSTTPGRPGLASPPQDPAAEVAVPAKQVPQPTADE